MNPAELLRIDILMELAHDDMGLWEIAWRARTLFPDSDAEGVRRIARDVIIGLVTSGEARLTTAEAPEPPIAQLENWLGLQAWLADPPDTRLWLTILPAGDGALSSLAPEVVREVARYSSRERPPD